MRIALIAPTHTLRLGLRALVEEAMGTTSFDTKWMIIREAAALDQLDLSNDPEEVVLVAGEAATSTALRQAASANPGTIAMLMLTDNPRMAAFLQSLRFRAWGVLPADSSAREIEAALLAISEGLVVGKSELLSTTFFRQPLTELDEDRLLEHLTERENQVLQLLARGLANKQIAAGLGISEHTVKFHVSSVFTKLGVTSRTEAVRVGLQQGLVVL